MESLIILEKNNKEISLTTTGDEARDEVSSVKEFNSDGKVLSNNLEGEDEVISSEGEYKVYKMRFGGLIALIIFNIVCALSWVLFSSISDLTSTHFEISLTEVNWLANIVCGMYVLSAPFLPYLIQKLSLLGVVRISAFLLLLGSWFRYAATISSLSSSSSYTLLFIGSALIGISQCWFQIVPVTYAENWFGIKGRTTAVMLMSVANPFGGAVGDFLAPAIVSDPTQIPTLMLIVAIVSTVVFPFIFLVRSEPITPPTRSAELSRERGRDESEGLWNGLLVLLGLRKGELESRERYDFWIIAVLFAILIGFFDAFLTLINQIFEPQGYDANTSGFIGAAVILSGLLGALISAPLFDRYFQFRLALAAKILVPLIGISFLALIWVVAPNNLAPIYAICVLLGISSFTMLPVALELAADIVYKVCGPATTTSILYLLGNGFSVITVVAMNALRAGDNASPPGNMKTALMFEGIFVFAFSFLIFGLKGRQGRKEVDVARRG